MTTLLITHPACIDHDPGTYHPESPARLKAILAALDNPAFQVLERVVAPRAEDRHLMLAHPAWFVNRILGAIPPQGRDYLDGDTVVSPGSGEAALRAAGAVVAAVDAVVAGKAQTAFCAVRPPGHHAEPDRAMGFCLFNNIAIGAFHARAQHGLGRVAVMDFDVHHGNGTEDIFRNDPRVMMAGIFQHPFYPYCGVDNAPAHMCNVPLPAGTRGDGFRQVFSDIIVPALRNHNPQMIFVSAGFDAHYEDDMGSLGLLEADYVWATQQIKGVAEDCGHKRIVSLLEGGYALSSLARSVVAHIKALADL